MLITHKCLSLLEIEPEPRRFRSQGHLPLDHWGAHTNFILILSSLRIRNGIGYTLRTVYRNLKKTCNFYVLFVAAFFLCGKYKKYLFRFIFYFHATQCRAYIDRTRRVRIAPAPTVYNTLFVLAITLGLALLKY